MPLLSDRMDRRTCLLKITIVISLILSDTNSRDINSYLCDLVLLHFAVSEFLTPSLTYSTYLNMVIGKKLCLIIYLDGRDTRDRKRDRERERDCVYFVRTVGRRHLPCVSLSCFAFFNLSAFSHEPGRQHNNGILL